MKQFLLRIDSDLYLIQILFNNIIHCLIYLFLLKFQVLSVPRDNKNWGGLFYHPILIKCFLYLVHNVCTCYLHFFITWGDFIPVCSLAQFLSQHNCCIMTDTAVLWWYHYITQFSNSFWFTESFLKF